jgi:hypothetical protein
MLLSNCAFILLFQSHCVFAPISSLIQRTTIFEFRDHPDYPLLYPGWYEKEEAMHNYPRKQEGKSSLMPIDIRVLVALIIDEDRFLSRISPGVARG